MIKSVYVVNRKVSHLVVCVKVGALNSSISLLSFIEPASMMESNFSLDLRKMAGNWAFVNTLNIPRFSREQRKIVAAIAHGQCRP